MLPEKTNRPSVFVPKIILSSGEVGGYGPTPQFGLGYEFHNGTSEHITVVNRSGLRTVIPPLHNARFHYLSIICTYKLGFNVNVDTHDLLNDEGHATSLEAQKLEGAFFNDDIRPGHALGRRHHIEYRISRNEFHENAGALYVPNLDLVLSIHRNEHVCQHPYSKVGVRQALIDNDHVLSLNEGLSYQVKIVDRHGKFGDRFVNIDSNVFHIRTIRNSDVPDGVYVLSPVPSIGQMDMSLPLSAYYTFDEAEASLHLYKTFMDAKTLGNPNDMYKRELEQRAHELKKEQQLWNEQVHRRTIAADAEKRAWEIERDRIKREQALREDALQIKANETARIERETAYRRAQLEHDLQYLKEINEERNYIRKEQSERRKEILDVIKYIPALITGLGGIYLAYKKIKK